MQNTQNMQNKITIEKLAANLPGTLLVYKADESEEIIFVSDGVVNLFECESADDFLKFTGGSLLTLVYPEDIEDVNSVIRAQLKNPENTFADDYVQYRVITKSGKIKTVEDWGRFVHDPELGDLYYVYLNDIAEGERLSRIASTKTSKKLHAKDSKNNAQVPNAEMTDKLTGLASEHALRTLGESFIARIFDIGMQPSIVHFHVQNLLSYDEAYGLEGGNRMMKSIARILQDTFTNSLIARTENDRFVVITSKEDLPERISKMTARVSSMRKDANVEIKAGTCRIPKKFKLEDICNDAKNACDSIRSDYQK